MSAMSPIKHAVDDDQDVRYQIDVVVRIEKVELQLFPMVVKLYKFNQYEVDS